MGLRKLEGKVLQNDDPKERPAPKTTPGSEFVEKDRSPVSVTDTVQPPVNPQPPAPDNPPPKDE